MTEEPQQDLDERLRRAFEPDPTAVSRVARGAFAPPSRTLTARRLAVAAGAAVLCVAAVLALWRSPAPTDREPVVESVNASFVDGVCVLPLPDGSAAVTSSEPRDDRPPDGYGIVLVEGVLR